jgi:GT2 family glycosyltransferase
MNVAHALPPSKGANHQSRITVSVVSHGQRNLVAALLQELAELNNSDITRVVLIHNLPDADLEKPALAVYELIQIHNDKPLGFSANHNLAFVHCATPWFAVLNPDLEFRFGDPFLALLAAGEADPKLGMLAPVLIQPDTMEAEPNRGMVTPYEIIRRRLPGWAPPDKPIWLVGAFLFVRRLSFFSVHGFDERFRLYCEDVDLSLRIVKEGFRIEKILTTMVIHHAQRDSRKKLIHTFWHISSLLRFNLYLLSNKYT